MKLKKYAGLIVKSNNKVLLCKRNNEGSLPGEWSVPGGKLEKGETPLEGIEREYYEETNNKVTSPLNLCGILDRHTRDGKNLKGVMYTFYTEIDEEILPDLENAKDGSEHTECGYFSVDDIPSPIQNDLKDLIKKILSKKVEN